MIIDNSDDSCDKSEYQSDTSSEDSADDEEKYV